MALERVVDPCIERVGGVQCHRLGAREAPPLGRAVVRRDRSEQRLQPRLVDAHASACALDAGEPEVDVTE
jgi:hypothetical protein